MSSQDSCKSPAALHHGTAADLAAELGEPVTWSPLGFLIRGCRVADETSVRAIAQKPLSGLRADAADERLAAAADLPPGRAPSLADLQEEFGPTHQITVEELCLVAIRRPHPTVQEVTTGRTPADLLAKLRAERDGAS